MPQEDAIHGAVKRALQRDGWIIVGEQVYLQAGGRNIWIDLKAERAIDEHKETVFLEIKDYSDSVSLMNQLHLMVGQFVVYRAILRNLVIPLELCLAVSQVAYEMIWSQAPGLWVRQQENMRLVIVNVAEEKVVGWIP